MAHPQESGRPYGVGWAARDTSGILSPFHFFLRENGKDDLTIRILYRGICYKDYEIARNGWSNATYTPWFQGRKLVGGSLSGGTKETQEMLDFCGEHNIVADVETIKMDSVNPTMERLIKGDVKYRFVIDITNSFSAT